MVHVSHVHFNDLYSEEEGKDSEHNLTDMSREADGRRRRVLVGVGSETTEKINIKAFSLSRLAD